MIERGYISEVATERGTVVAAGSAEGKITKLSATGTGTVAGITTGEAAAGKTQSVCHEGVLPLGLLGAACRQFDDLVPTGDRSGKLRPLPATLGTYTVVGRALAAGSANQYIAIHVTAPRQVTVA